MPCLLLRSDMKLEALNIADNMFASLAVVVEWCMLFVDMILLHWNTGLLVNASVYVRSSLQRR